MTSWVHLFSKFTSEALLFEAAFICFAVGSYIAYYVVRKRREGSVNEVVPSSVVKVYLNELITDAEQMRAQLFGLLQSSGITPGSIGNSEAGRAALLASLQAHAPSSAESAAGANDSELLHKISALESRMKDQARAMELLVQEKTRIEGELTLAKATAVKPQPAGASSVGGPDTGELQRKIAQLEAKLSEYSVIEDDLANLKRLQQENAELKGRLSASANAPESTGEAAPAKPAAEAALQTTGAEPAPEMIPAEDPGTAAVLQSNSAPAAVEPVTAPSTEPQADVQAAFATLANQVDASLTEAASTAPADSAPAAAPGSTAESQAEKRAEDEKKPSEADLLAEFEKMLNG